MRKRQGSYQKSFFNEAQLREWLPALTPHFELAKINLAQGRWTSAEFTASFLLCIWKTARPRQWQNGPRPMDSDEIKISKESPLFEIQNIFLRGIPPQTHDLLMAWHQGRVPLSLHLDIPSSTEVLNAQCQGQRCVSVLIESETQFLLGGEDRDSFSFALHDLIHASHFYQEEKHFNKQVFFSRWMQNFIQAPLVQEKFESDAHFKNALDYLISDMNTHWIHAVKCLKSLLTPLPQLIPFSHQALAKTCLSSCFSMNEYLPLWNQLNTPQESEFLREHLDHYLGTFLSVALKDLKESRKLPPNSYISSYL